MTNFFTHGRWGGYFGKWTMNFLSSFGTMAFAGIVQSAYTNSIWGPRAEVVLDSEEREKQRKADKLEAEPDWLQRIDNPTPEDFVAMSNYLPFGRQLLEQPLKMVDKIEKATVDQFSGAKYVTRFRDINAAIRKTMEKLKTERGDAMEEHYGTPDVLEATHRYSQLNVGGGSQDQDQATENKRILESLASI